MSHEFWVKRFSYDLDKILEKDGQLDFKTGDKEYDRVLHLAHVLKNVDFSGESKVKEKLKVRLLKQIEDRKKKQLQEILKDELSDEELDYAAGGIGIDWNSLKDENNKD